MKFLKTAAMALAVMGCASTSGTYAQTPASVLVLTESDDTGSLDRNNRISRRVIAGFKNELNQEGYTVYDEAAVTGTTIDANIKRFDRGALANIAKNYLTYPGSDRQLTVDIVTTFVTYARIVDEGYAKSAKVRISGQVMDARSGQFFGEYELVDPTGGIALPSTCNNSDCLLEEIGDHAREIGAAVAYEVTKLLQSHYGGNMDDDGFKAPEAPLNYSLKFSNVTSAEVAEMEEYLVSFGRADGPFPGYQSHKLTRSLGTTHYFEYVSTDSTAIVKRHLEKAMSILGWEGQVYVNQNEFTIDKRAVRGGRRNKDWN